LQSSTCHLLFSESSDKALDPRLAHLSGIWVGTHCSGISAWLGLARIELCHNAPLQLAVYSNSESPVISIPASFPTFWPSAILLKAG
jgi:hypothetical protein